MRTRCAIYTGMFLDMSRLPLSLLATWLQGLPVQAAQAAGATRPDTSQHLPALPPIGQDAAAVLQDSLASLPQRAERWVSATIGAAVRLLPRLLLALFAAAVIIALTIWVRRIVVRREGLQAVTRQGSKVGLTGLLAAGVVAAAIAGASTLAAALLVFLIFQATAALAQLFGQRILRRSRVGPGASELLLAVVRTALLALGIVEALATIGLNLGGVFAGLGIIGLAVGFAAQDTLANLIAGFTILWDRPIAVGDWVQIGDGPPGRVRHLTLRTTRIETIDLGMLVVPNKDVTGARLYNYTMLDTGRLRFNVGISIDADVEKARGTLIRIAAADSRVAQSPPPVVNVVAIGDAAITLELIVNASELHAVRPLRATLTEQIITSFRAAGMKVMEPHPPPEGTRGPWTD
jgi:small conductance mechanosensitive channel